jgi:hypothetical protein
MAAKHLLDDLAAQVSDQAVQSAFNESAEQLPQQGRIGEGLQPSAFPVADFPVAQAAARSIASKSSR